ncbi:MAG: helix-turn-helix domain-containing protein, partial [Bacillales bacterium]|nr:helix-turn-helix domain-containing protein [Bacillales bacterium]
MRNLRVKSVVYYEHIDNDYILMHQHLSYECVFYITGKGILSADGEKYEFKAPCATIVSPKINHDELDIEGSNVFIVIFDCEDFPFTFKKYDLTNEAFKEYYTIFSKMQEYERGHSIYSNNIINHYFSIFLLSLLQEDNNIETQEYDTTFLKRIKTFIKENYSQKIDYNFLANSIGYSYHRLRHKFVELTGVALNKYLNNFRLDKAKILLQDTNKNLSQIGIECGFASDVYFATAFKKHFNLTPMEYRNEVKNTYRYGITSMKKEIPKLFIDTDLGGDCDDALAIALANIAHNNKQAILDTIIHVTTFPYGVGCVKVINDYYGNKIDIGSYQNKEFLNEEKFNIFVEKTCQKYNVSLKNNDVENSITLLRRKLAMANDYSITYVSIGTFNNISDLIDSKGDDISALTGKE